MYESLLLEDTIEEHIGRVLSVLPVFVMSTVVFVVPQLLACCDLTKRRTDSVKPAKLNMPQVCRNLAIRTCSSFACVTLAVDELDLLQ